MTKPQTFYIGGGMRGRPMHNFPEFFRVAMALREADYCVVNPAEIDMANGMDPNSFPSNAEVRDMLRKDFAQILNKCTDLVLLPSWRASRGACAEAVLAFYIGLPIWEWFWDAQRDDGYYMVLLEDHPEVLFACES